MGVGLRQGAVNRAYDEGHRDGFWLGSFEKQQELAPYIRSLEKEKLNLLAEVARLRQLMPPDDPEETAPRRPEEN